MAADVITKPKITSVVLTPNPVAAAGRYTVQVFVAEERYVATVNPRFEFAFSNDSLTDKLLNMGEITYEKET